MKHQYRKIGIIGAMDEEIELLLQQLEQVRRTERAGVVYHEGVFRDRNVVVCKSGVGKVNAAVTTQILIDAYGVDCILFTGVAGALHPSLNIGDIVVSTTCMQHDIDVSALGFPRGVIPFQERSEFAAAPDLVELAAAACEGLFGGRHMLGKVLSGDQFIADRSIVKELFETMDGACVEMEGAAVAQVCAMNGTPFVVIRSMSDKADGSAHTNFPEFTKQASEHSVQIISEMINHF
ncbi:MULTISPECIES: 5'-methylthioadenosine/adenosylhomocysteine nucleosidase [unclassified Paenibacillus]|uniref:5'-methylthioadenosine/adenosylhomocysteine nucleosidase n=1 Tax=unclassified Paenibacillus TaxID=185978 RepID=UPI001C103887|nr:MULTISPECIES: 5'-methylthioadenosine/adenosylhomocysteine nucleosidase [unclassified Paenibacillus]MBU5440600.1 5'-methylthioadenosine/adenosylhomocysteine nucleosidase [Paenibacillus sp. MSJ-34]CAH0120067.1 5'-methylthioadenosine/S-adenosylhomocysteine nucleosidase [Paenibacillus sp. CECT 9249]